MSLPADLLRRPRREAVRLLALEQLGAVRKAAPRLADVADEEALHAFRVAIRRLRSITKAWRRELRGLIHREERKALSELQAATGAGRDAEVLLVWLAKQRDELADPQRPGFDWLAERLRKRLAQAMAVARENVTNSFRAQDEHWDSVLGDARRDREKKGHFGKALKRSVRRHRKALRELLAGVESTRDEERLHRARIAVKRLRYLVEPVRHHASAAHAVVASCKRLQDLLGEINDTHVQQREIGSALEELEGKAAAAKLLPGLEELQRREAERLASLETNLKQDWLADDLKLLTGPVRTLVQQLTAPA